MREEITCLQLQLAESEATRRHMAELVNNASLNKDNSESSMVAFEKLRKENMELQASYYKEKESKSARIIELQEEIVRKDSHADKMFKKSLEVRSKLI